MGIILLVLLPSNILKASREEVNASFVTACPRPVITLGRVLFRREEAEEGRNLFRLRLEVEVAEEGREKEVELELEAEEGLGLVGICGISLFCIASRRRSIFQCMLEWSGLSVMVKFKDSATSRTSSWCAAM